MRAGAEVGARGLEEFEKFFRGEAGVFDDGEEEACAEVFSLMDGHDDAAGGVGGMFQGNVTAFLVMDEKSGFGEGLDHLFTADRGQFGNAANSTSKTSS